MAQAKKTTIDFAALLGKQVGTAPEPKALPAGTYTGQIAEQPTTREVTTKEGAKGVLVIKYAITGFGEDVSEEEVADAGGLLRGNGDPRTLTSEFWLDEDSLWRLDQFLAGFGFSEDSGQTYAEVLDGLAGQGVTLLVTQEEYTRKGATKATTVNRVERAYAE